MQQLREQQIAAGAICTTKAGLEIPFTFNNATAAFAAVHDGVALYDRSHWGQIQVAGADRIRFLHNQTTNNFTVLQPGQGCDTVFVTPTARTIDLVTAYLLDESVLLLTSPGYAQRIMEWMDRFIFFADQVEPKDLTNTTAAFSLLGSNSQAFVEKLGAGAIVGQPNASHVAVKLNDMEVRVAVGSSLAIPGYTLLTTAEQAAAVWQTLFNAGAVPMGEQLWEQLRVEQGRPIPGQELTDDYNPLEAGLWQTISLSKGCYIGQETIARLHTYKGVKQQLWGIRLTQFAEPKTPVMAGDEKIGRLTSCTQSHEGYFGLAYIRTKNVAPELPVRVGASEGVLAALPFVSHEYI